MINFEELVTKNEIPMFVPEGIEHWQDRFEKARELHHWINRERWKQYNTDTRWVRWRQADIPELTWADRHEGDVFSWDRDYYRIDRNDPEIVVRDKIYLPQFFLEPEKYEIIKDNETLLYWYNFCSWAMPMAEKYADVFESNNNKKFKKMMIIRYWCPDSENDRNYSLTEQREFCSEKFGVDHYDETYGSLHLGETDQELQVERPDGSENWIPVDLTGNDCLCIVGEEGGEIRQDIGGTNHRLIHNKESQPDYERYSLILDVDPR